ncbi:MAG: glycosyltransferase family 4 protein [Terriglobia bacterium]|jgi:glycosyltransferase involved in cell wall biosynthesis
MHILMVHNKYLLPGGEDISTEAEVALLKDNGIDVETLYVSNEQIKKIGKVKTSLRSVWSQETYQEVLKRLSETHFDVVHVQNFFPLVSPSIYYAAKKKKVAVVQTLRNYRLFCPNAVLFRKGRPCEDCLNRRIAWPGVVHACYKRSHLGSGVVAAMLFTHHVLRTWTSKVDAYVALTDFALRKFAEAGFPRDKLLIKPNFVHPDPGLKNRAGEYALYVGRLSEEKGVRVLLAAWGMVRSCIPLRIAGDGPMRKEMAAEIEAKGLQSVELLGHVSPSEIVTLMHGARFLVFPSEWYETFGRVAIEAFACGLPVVASRLGSMAEIIADGENGLHFAPGDGAELAEKVEWAWTHPEEVAAMGRAARAEYEAKYTPERNYKMLMEIYQRVLGARGYVLGARVSGGSGTQ